MVWFVVAIVLLVLLILTIIFLNKFYRKAIRKVALIRTGAGGQLVVLDGGCIAMPFLHKVSEVNMKTTRLEMERQGAVSQNLSRKLKGAYDALLNSHGLLLMPTTPMKATPLPPADASLALYCQRAFEMLPNTAPFDVTCHPAMSVPCGMSDGLPVGMMLIGRHYEESTIYRAAAVFEQLDNWKRM